jgi:HD-like signal output (HDOD) protein/ActR/RegA family two-component response regulator
MIEILFVDDQPEELALLEKSLRKFRQEWSMHFSSSGAEALRKLSSQPFDVVVCDLNVADISGAEVLRAAQKQSPQAIRMLMSRRGDRVQAVESTGIAHQHLAKPCDVDLLEMIINDTFALRYHLDSQNIRELVGRLDTLPTLPDTYSALLLELESPYASLARAGDLIRRDVTISAKILKLVNSSYFGLPVHVTDVSHATALLGLNIVKPLVLSSGLFEQFSPKSLGDYSLNHLMDHSAEVALAARCLAQLEGASPEDCDNAFMAGMLHDLGQLVLAKNFTAQYDQMREHAHKSGTPLDELELAEFQANHADLGAYLLGLWGLPAPIVESIVWHHRPFLSTHDRWTPLAAVHAAEAFLTQQKDPIGESSGLSHEFLARIGRNDRASVWAVALGAETAMA